MKKPTAPTRCVEMCITDTQMDLYGNVDKPANPLPVKCPHCTFPDLDFVARPYLLAKGVDAPGETASAEVGNFLVRERVRRILEVAVPGACTFHPTAEMKSRKPTSWFLAVPKQIIELPKRETPKPRCSKCGEPRDGHAYGPTYWEKMNEFDTGGADIFKDLHIGSCHAAEEALARTNAHRKKSGLDPLPWSYYEIDEPPHPERWTRLQFHRALYFSVRLELLFKKAKIKGKLVQSSAFGEPTPEDLAWVDEKLAALAAAGLADAPKSSVKKSEDPARRWFEQYLKKNARKAAKPPDFGTVERKNKIKLPQRYKDFIATVGPKEFEDVNDTEGFTARILPPQKLDFRTYRKGKLKDLDEDSAMVDGLLFATTDHGDCFVFDMAGGGAEPPVYWYDHEQNSMETFAPGFAACIKRFAERN